MDTLGRSYMLITSRAKERKEFTVKLGKLGNLEIFQEPYSIEMKSMRKTQFNYERQK